MTKTSPAAGRPSGSTVRTGIRRPSRAAASTSRKPGPPSASGRASSSSPGATSRQPWLTAATTSGAERVPANLSGQKYAHAGSVAAHISRSSTAARLWDDECVTATWGEPSATATALLLLGRGSDPATERGVECPGDLPAPSDPDLVARATAAKAALGDKLFVLGHHYQRDEVIQFADVTGDSFKLAREAAARPQAEYIVFCGVHFMAESADILTTATSR